MKITIKAILVNEPREHKNIIDNMMLVFSTAIRYSFKRLLEGKKIPELEKDVAKKYNLNIRQAKDAAESARQTIVSQKELIKMNYEEYEKKVKAIEKTLNDKDVNSKFARIKNNFIYSKLLTMLESACYREGIELVKVHPAYTSKIELYKYCHQYGMV